MNNMESAREEEATAELKKITFVNTGRFSYGEVDVNGNTLITGTNGAGKTTTILAILFFYGTTTRQSMGLLKSEGKEDWFAYTYPNINSYVIYEYIGVFGRVLLVTYHAGTKIGYRFASVKDDFELDMKSLTLTENNIPRKKEELFAKMLSTGLEFSQQVASTAIYRQILYGAIDARVDKRLSSFSNYALMRTKGDYRLIHEMQSSIFLSSKIESGAIEKAIADNFGNGEEIDISKIQGQLDGVISDYEAIRLYDKEKKLIDRIFKEYDNYKINEDKFKQMIRELIAANNYDIGKLPQLKEEMESTSIALQDCQNSNGIKMVEIAAQRDTATSELESVKSDLRRATSLFEKYKNADMQSKALKVDNLPILKLERDTAKKNYDTLIEEQKDIARVYEKKLEDETSSHAAKKTEISQRVEKARRETESAIDTFTDAQEKRIEALEKENDIKLQEIAKQEEDAERAKNIANKDFIKTEALNPFAKELSELKTNIQQLEQKTNACEAELKNHKEKVHSLVEKRELNERQIANYCDGADEKLKLLKKPINKEIDKLVKQLEIDKDTLLYFIREYMGEKENLLTYFLSEKALYSKTLEPSLTKDDNTIFGININQEAIGESTYTREKITERINECNKKIKEIAEKVESELEEKKKEPLKQIEIINKEIFFANKDINDTDRELIEHGNRLIELKTELHDRESDVNKRWQELKDRLKKEYDERESLYREVRKKKNDFLRECNLEISGIKNNIKRFKTDKRESFNKYVQSENEKLKKLEEQFKKTTESIEEDKNTALVNGGIDPLKLKEAKELQETAEANYNEANAFIESVAVWREDKKSIDLIPQLQKEHDVAKTMALEKTKAYDDALIRTRREESSLSQKLNGLKSSIQHYEKRVEDLNRYMEDEFRYYIKQYKIDNTGERIYVENIHKVRGDALLLKDGLTGGIKSISDDMVKFVSMFGGEKNIWFNYDNSTPVGTISSVESLRTFIESGGFDSTKEIVAKSVRSIQDNISERYNRLKAQGENIHTMVDKISRRLSKAVDNIVVLDDISIKYEKSENRILQKLEEISEIELPYGEMNSLFAEPAKSKNTSSEILKKFGELLSYLEVEKEKSVTIADTFEIKIKAVENGNSTGWVMARKRIGSEGTSIIIKTLLYVVMLDTVLSMTKRDQNVLVHVLVDEVGKIDQKNLREIINFSNKLSISMFSASPDAKTPDLFNHIYYYKIINGKTKIILGAKKI